ncbi:CD1375 family protein [Acetobacterium wieringae]|nr:CD1375 family protein [Acetobacterium wieringae]URN83958.1 hypothetical protein CHL1_003122 [Acetobacterium wieringae]
MIVKMYADLVALELRALTEADATAWGCPMVPAVYRVRVTAEIESRKTV